MYKSLKAKKDYDRIGTNKHKNPDAKQEEPDPGRIQCMLAVSSRTSLCSTQLAINSDKRVQQCALKTAGYAEYYYLI